MENKIDESKERILNESLELFKKHGINYVTMDIIAANLGISKKTLYISFQSKEELLRHCLNNYIRTRKEQYRAVANSTSNIIEGMVAMFAQMIKDISQFNAVFYDELSRYFPQLSMEMVNNQKDKDYNELTRLIDLGKVQGLILQNIHTDIVAKLSLAQISHISDYELFPIDRYSRNELFQQVYINYIRGIATYEGQTILKDLLESHRYTDLQP